MMLTLLLAILCIGLIAVILVDPTRAAEYIPELFLIIVAPLWVRPPYVVSVPPYLLALILVALIRRWPWVARRLLPWPVPSWVLPGAVETVDSGEAPAVDYRAKLMSSAKRVVNEENKQKLLTRRIRRAQETLHQNAKTPRTPEPVRTPPAIVTVPIDGEDARMAALLYGMGKTPAQVARLLAGYSGDQHKEYVAKAEALKAALGGGK